MARFSSGWAGSCSSCLSILSNCVPLKVVSAFGLKVGYEASARIAPVLGWIATTAAAWPPSLVSAL